MAKIRKIEPKTPKIKKRKKVAAYARVSAESDRMMHSLSAQISYYSKLIQGNPEWEYAGVYADSFISGTGIKQRKEFRRLVEDCEQGKIDIVLCKSISRFARNTVDLLETVRHLKELGIEVRFEKERINSLSGDGELMLSLLACFAQEESHSISENCKWGIRKRFESGEIGTANKHILGYQYDETLRKYVIIPEEAEIVRRIVELYLNRFSLQEICDDLNGRGWRTVNGCLFQEAWMSTMLHNEVYAGDTLRQKKYIEDPITKNKVKNKGELPMYYMPDTHEAIIDRETWGKVQEELARRESLLNPTYCFSGRMKCGICGRPYTRHADWTKGKLYPRWICRAKKESGITCTGVNYSEKKLMEISAEILGFDSFDEAAFTEQVRELTVQENGDLVFQLVGGETKTWVRPPKPPKPVRKKRPPGHCFDGKIFCGACGCRFGRSKSDTKDQHIYWHCRAKNHHGVTCDSVNYPDAELKEIFCEVMGTEPFDEDYFSETVDRIVVQKAGSVDFYLKDGTLRTFKALKLRVNKHISTSTDEFAGKIRCAARGNLFKRSVHRGKYVYWHCSGKDKVRTECKAKNIAENEIRQVAAYVMEMDEFSVPEFERQIDPHHHGRRQHKLYILRWEGNQMAKKVIKIPARVNKFTATPIGTTRKRRVAAYARVSTDHEEQLNSYEAQVDYYTNYIKGREDWEFVSVYADEGITGTSIKKRAGFSKMVDDALAGHIDLIVTKSVSRFARNTVDSLTTIRKLKESGVEVYFEEQNIYTFDSSGELLITIMSSLAQEEARSISENTTWGQRKRFPDGKVMVPFGRFLGYERGENGELVVNEEQAEIVRRIYGLFLQGHSPYQIAKQLTAEGIPTPGGKVNWGSATVRSILTNEKYKGDALLQKVFTTDFLTKKKKVNEGEVPQYYIEGNHEAIIAPDVFDSVQLLMEKRVKNDGRPSCVNCFSSKIKCGHCGAWYGSKVWHSNSKYRRIIWRCNRKYENEERCDTPHLYEEDIKKMFVRALNSFCSEKEAILADFESIKATAFQTDELEKKRDELQNELTVLMEMMERSITENVRVALDQTEYEARYKALEEKAETTESLLDSVNSDIVLKQAQREMMKNFIAELRKLPETCEQFDEDTWYALVDYVTVYSAEDIHFTFYNGAEVKI